MQLWGLAKFGRRGHAHDVVAAAMTRSLADVSPEVKGVAFNALSSTDTVQESYLVANLGQAMGSDHS